MSDRETGNVTFSPAEKSHQRVAEESDIHAAYRLILAEKKANQNLTVAVFDLCGSTKFRVDHGARAAFARIERLNYIVEYWARRTRGTTVKHIGDGVMVSFPPVPGFDGGPVRAVECARNVISTLKVQTAAKSLPAKAAADMACKVGIAQGAAEEIDLVQGHGVVTIDYLGTVLDRASRIASICKPHQILIDNTAHEGVTEFRDQFKSDRYTISVKGLGAIDVYDLSPEPLGIRADVSEITSLAEYREVMERVLSLVKAAEHDLHTDSAIESDQPYLLVLVDSPAFGSFTFPDMGHEYLSAFSRFATGGGPCAIVTLAPETAERSCRLQLTKDKFDDARKNNDELKARFKRLRITRYDALIKHLMACDKTALDQLREAGVCATSLNSDPRLHAWIRGFEEAVVSFVLLDRIGRGVGNVKWAEVGFHTSNRTVVAMLRNYVRTVAKYPF